MFFMIGVTDGYKDLEYSGRITSCPACGIPCGCSVFMTYTVLLLFFIPCFKWNRRYFARTSCCNRTYELSFEKGDAIRKGDDSDILPSQLFPVEDISFP
ncbi:MAG: zinc ribbon domain-containing protein [Lachnospiraceae bacterium]|nr:zinc ribbon domain-containing protein [Lachnospiraceae bacterium]